MSFLRRISMTSCIFMIGLWADISGQGLLTVNDIQPIMQQIFDQHVDQRTMDAKNMHNAIKVYFNKFDPDRIYLLQSEVQPFLELSSKQLAEAIAQYKQNNFALFEKMDNVIQSAIYRARAIRRDLEKNSASLFGDSSGDSFNSQEDPDLKQQFATNRQQLSQHIKTYMQKFINAEKLQFGNKAVMQNQPQTIKILEKDMAERENNYLYLDDQGAPLPKKDKENLFALHILKAMASGLDAHTAFYDEAEASDLKTRLQKEFEGVGIIFQQTLAGQIIVNDISEGGPAAKSGLVKMGDSVLEINGKTISGMPFDKVMEMIRTSDGSNSSELELTLKHKGSNQIVKVRLKKQEMAVDGERAEVSFKRTASGLIGLITLNSFYQNANGINSADDVKAALDLLRQKGNLRGLILDLRDNSGGFLNQAVKVAGLFITNGVIVVSKYFNGEEHFYRDIDNKVYFEGPLVILTSRATASAAEIVAQALQDYGVAIVVGDETTYGKGTIQNQNITTSHDANASLFKVTVGKYYTVSGKTPQLQGVKADIVVPGIFNYEHLGEQYLELTIPNDTIQNEYADNLDDVSSNLKAWYQHYYLPTLQKKSQTWDASLPSLRANSRARLAANKNYQAFLKQAQEGHPTNFFIREENGTTRQMDFQLDEAVNIVQDMLNQQQQQRSKTIADKASL